MSAITMLSYNNKSQYLTMFQCSIISRYSLNLFFFVITITKLLCENDNVIYKKYNHCALSLTYNLKIQKDIKVL